MNAATPLSLALAVSTILIPAVFPSCTMLERRGRQRELVGRFQDRAQQWYDAGQLSRAEYMAKRALEIDPDDFKSNLLLGYVALRTPAAKGRNDLALTSFERARRSRDDYRVSLGIALAHQREAARLRSIGGPDPDTVNQRALEHLNEAEKAFRITLRRIPDYPRALAGLGQVLALKGEYDEAIRVLGKTAGFATSSEKGYRKLQQRVETASENRLLEDRLDAATTQEVELRGLLANLLFKQGRYQEAIVQLDRVLEIAPGRFVEYLNRARCHLELGHADPARKDAEAFLAKSRLDLNSPLVREALRIRSEAGSEAAVAPSAPSPPPSQGGSTAASLAGNLR